MTSGEDREITVSRVVEAPVERVWQAISDRRSLPHWWGPRGFTTTVQEMDLRPGGAWNYVMNGFGVISFLNRSVFTEVVEPERIVYINGSGAQGRTAMDFESSLTLEAIDEGCGTEVTIRMVFSSTLFRNQFVQKYNALEGGKQTLERLAAYVAKTADSRR